MLTSNNATVAYRTTNNVDTYLNIMRWAGVEKALYGP